MRIIQIIDSLDAGGAERMAVNYANALGKAIEFSGLVVTRKEGLLKSQLDDTVSYLFLNKKNAIDFKAVFRLRSYIVQHKITFIHAHSTSFFLAFLLKVSHPSIKLIWHDHYGDSEFLNQRPIIVLKRIIPFFNGIISVNKKLKHWAEQKLHCNKVIYLPNFPSKANRVDDKCILKGIDGKRIVCLANLRVQKDHFLLLEVARKLKLSHPEWTFHLIGKDFQDDYSRQIKGLIVSLHLEKNVFLYGTKQDVENILDQTTIAVLTSQSKGLPVALLEYGWHKKPVVVTDVGEISSLVQNGVNGFLIAAHKEQLFYDAIVTLITNKVLQNKFGEELFKVVHENHSESAVINHYLSWLDTL